MSFIDLFRASMPHVVVWEQRTGVDQYNRPTYAAGVSITCYLDRRPRLVRSVDGQEVTSNTTVYLDGVYGLDHHDRLTLPSGRQPPILSVATYADEGGDEYEEVAL